MLVIGDRGLAVSRVLCVGAHADDIEIGAGGTMLSIIGRRPDIAVDWVVLSADDEREQEARTSAERILPPSVQRTVSVERFRERYFPYEPTLKEYFDALGGRPRPDLVIGPWRGDAHQDHRTVAELVAQTFRDQLILEYEIPKQDGDLGRPSVYVHLPRAHAEAKIDALMEGFPSQAARPWFDADTFRGLMRLRGVESGAPDGMAEAFHCRRLVLA